MIKIHKLKEIKNSIVFLPEENNREIKIYHLDDVSIEGENLFYPNAFIYSKKDKKIYNPLQEKTMSLQNIAEEEFFHLPTSEQNKVEENPLFYFVYNTDNYYHFLYDTVPYLISFLHLKNQIKDLKLLVNYPNVAKNEFYTFFLEFLKLLEIKKTDLLVVDKNTLYKKIFISSSYTHGRDPNLAPRKEVYQLFKSIVNKVKKEYKNKNELCEKIYISRRTWVHNDFSNLGTNYTSRRKMVNEDELVERLVNKGYKEVFTENLDMIEKIFLFSSAKEIIGSIGGGLANALFCDHNVKLQIIVSPTFFEINERFQHCFKDLKVSYFLDTEHIEKQKHKKFIRVLSHDNKVGEILEVLGEKVLISYLDNKVAGWNSLVPHKKKLYDKKDISLLDGGLNSMWKVNLEKFIKEVE
tara:strand:+ start:732 stop:1961 length:1230 start_codon:yes stop_codon:yes gene_type:complete